jgi:hypothetical protein
MKSLLLVSIVIAAFAIPAITARDPNPRRGVKRMIFYLLAFNAIYLAYVAWVHPVLFVPHWPQP